MLWDLLVLYSNSLGVLVKVVEEAAYWDNILYKKKIPA